MNMMVVWLAMMIVMMMITTMIIITMTIGINVMVV